MPDDTFVSCDAGQGSELQLPWDQEAEHSIHTLTAVLFPDCPSVYHSQCSVQSITGDSNTLL